MENKITHNYSEYIDGLIGEKNARIEIMGQVFEEPLLPGGEASAPVHSRIVLILDEEGSRMSCGLRYFSGKLTESEIKAEVVAAKQNPTEYMYKEFADKFK